jgi:cytochrome b561
MTPPKGYSAVQIALHWIIALLILAQYVFHDAMVAAWRAINDGGTPVISNTVWGHIIGGSVILVLVLWRLVLRSSRGVPDAPEGTPGILRLGAHLGHLAIYALLILLPVTGLLAWYGGVGLAAQAHSILRIILFFLVVLHILAALGHSIIGHGVMGRMFQADRPS